MAVKYRILAQLLREEIAAHGNVRNYRLPTERDLTRRYGVSRQTVRCALTLLEQEGLIRRRQGSGSYAREGQTSAALQVAVIVTFADAYIFPGVLEDMTQVLQKQGYRLRVYVTENRLERERQILKELLREPVGGILMECAKTALPSPNGDLLQRLEGMRIPLVFFQGHCPGLPRMTAVTDDNFAGGYRLAEHLLDRGHRAIGGIFKSDDLQGPQRCAGMLGALRDRGLPLPDHRICWYDTDQRRTVVEDRDHRLLGIFLRERLASVTAVVCYNDEIAYHLILLLRSLGKRVPEDVAVVSFDNSYYCQLSPVPITSLGHSRQRMGREAARQLLNLLQGSSARSLALSWELFVRASG